ncbi:DUF1345 domain-containing protein [Rathayibacter sp. YIM 133350]|uniref:DUF1345 domain-containing protein n=1 Tax=Rathayibacter sp. YIM 133350 TaxID=3131992 RepID=UPI00307E2D4F
MALHRIIHHTQVRIYAMAIIGILVGAIVGSLTRWQFGLMSGWSAACIVFVWVSWQVGHGLDADGTRRHALRDDPARGFFETLVLLASLVCVVIVIIILIAANSSTRDEQYGIPLLGLVTIGATWTLVQTLFSLRYARLYYGDVPGGIEFPGGEAPDYHDFAYVAFTLGMTYQVSDTNLSSRDIRATALRQSIVSYLFGTVILAATVNVVAGLAG